MLKIKDRITLGILSGVIAGIPDILINELQYRMGLTDLTYSQIGANVFYPKNSVNSQEARVVGLLANGLMIGVSGVLFAYLLSATGRDKAELKGLGFGLFSWLAIYGLGKKMGLSVKSQKPLTPLLSFIDHMLFGSLLGFITPRLGDESLFPDVKSGEEKIPILSTD
jgi:hypothetical protein